MLRKITLGFWKEYSSISHTSYDGLIGIYQFIAPDRIPRESREASLDFGEALITTHLGRAAGILLCLLTEIQAFYRFKGASIDSRLHKIWRAVNVIAEIKELYEYRYEGLMKSKGIVDTPSEPREF